MDEHIVELPDNLFIGKGNHKAVYFDPRDPKRCIKVCFHENDEDLNREMKYRKYCHRNLRMLPNYYGTVQTNRGLGYVFELVSDYDGEKSWTLQNFLDHPQEGCRKYHCTVEEMLLTLYRNLMEDAVVTATIAPFNFCIQKISETIYRIRIIDDIGTSAKIPLPYFFRNLALNRNKRYWRRFVREMKGSYSEMLTAKVENPF